MSPMFRTREMRDSHPIQIRALPVPNESKHEFSNIWVVAAAVLPAFKKILAVGSVVSGVFGLFLQPAYAACPPDCPFQLQPIMFDTTAGKYIGVGSGPFTTMFPTGVGPTGVVPNDTEWAGTKLDVRMFKPTDFGSIGAAHGGPFKNLTKTDIGDIEVVGKKGNNFTGSLGGGGWDVTTGTDTAGNPTLTFKARPGNELKPGASLWMKIPEAPQPGDPAGRPTIFTGNLTPPAPVPPPAPVISVPPSVQTPTPPSPSPSPGPSPSPSINFNSSNNTLTFGAADITSATYLDGSVATSNGASETILGSMITIGQTELIGPFNDIPGAFLFSDSGLRITQGSTTFLAATLTDILLFPDNSVPAFDSRLQATLVWDQAFLGLGSRYLSEYFNEVNTPALLFDSNLLSLTSNLTQSSESFGTIDINITTAPEPSSLLLLATGLLGILGYGWRQRKQRA